MGFRNLQEKLENTPFTFLFLFCSNWLNWWMKQEQLFTRKMSKLNPQLESQPLMEAVWSGPCLEKQKLSLIWKTRLKSVTKRGGPSACTCIIFWDTDWWNCQYPTPENRQEDISSGVIFDSRVFFSPSLLFWQSLFLKFSSQLFYS